MRQLSPRDGRALVVGGVLILLALVPSRGLPAWRDWIAVARASAAELDSEAARAEASVRALPATLDGLEDRRKQLIGLAPVLVSHGSATDATSSLAAVMGTLASEADMRLASLRVRADSAASGPVQRVVAWGQATGGIENVTLLLAGIESHRWWLIVDELTITTADPAAPSDMPEALQVDFVVAGLALVREEVEEL